MSKKLSKRGGEWVKFSNEVLTHIETYTVPQYGDKGTDVISNWTKDQCMEAIYKYYKRHNTNQRKGQDYLDLLKVAHFACVASNKLVNEEVSEVSGNVDELTSFIQEGLNPNDEYSIIIRKKV